MLMITRPAAIQYFNGSMIQEPGSARTLRSVHGEGFEDALSDAGKKLSASYKSQEFCKKIQWAGGNMGTLRSKVQRFNDLRAGARSSGSNCSTRFQDAGTSTVYSSQLQPPTFLPRFENTQNVKMRHGDHSGWAAWLLAFEEVYKTDSGLAPTTSTDT